MSKKLEKNGLWESSRMTLPEQREALIKRREPAESHRVPTKEELTLIRAYAILPAIVNVVEKNLKQIEFSTYSLKKLYINALLVLLKQIHTDFLEVKKELRRHNIRIINEEMLDTGMKYRFTCNGFEGDFTLIRDVLKAEISVRLGKYIDGLFNSIKDSTPDG